MVLGLMDATHHRDHHAAETDNMNTTNRDSDEEALAAVLADAERKTKVQSTKTLLLAEREDDPFEASLVKQLILLLKLFLFMNF
jgi:hypothetical protein